MIVVNAYGNVAEVTYGPATGMHIATAKRMPRKDCPGIYGEAAKKYTAQLKRERKAIAAYYRLLRSGTVSDYTATSARLAHKYGQVTTGAEAKIRIKNLTA